MALYSSKRARRGLIDTIAFRGLSQLATMASFVIFVRSMPEEDFGVFNLLYAFIPVVSTVASLGLEQTLRRYQPEYLSNDNVPAARWLVRFVASARFAVNIVILGAILLAWNQFAPIFKLTPFRNEFALFCLPILLHFQARILQIALAGNMLHRFSVGSAAMLAVLKLPAYGVLAAYGELNLLTAILADTLAYASAYVFLIWAYRRHCPSPTLTAPFKPVTTEKRRLFRYGALNNFNDAGTLVLSTKSDNFFIAAFVDPVAVGIYAFYNRLNEMLRHLQPLNQFEGVVQPMFFAVPKEQADEQIPRYFSLLMNTTLLLQLPVLIFSVAYHAELVTVVFGGKFISYSALFPMIVAFATLQTIATPVTMVAQYEERAGIVLLSKVFALYNVAALIILIPVAGLYGAVIATGSAAVFKNLFIWWFARRRARWLAFRPMFLASLLTWGTTLGICFLAKSALNLSHFLNLALGIAIIGTAALVHVRTPALSDSDRRILARVLSGKESWILRHMGILPRGAGTPSAGT